MSEEYEPAETQLLREAIDNLRLIADALQRIDHGLEALTTIAHNTFLHGLVVRTRQE